MALNLPTCLGKTHVAKLNCVLLTTDVPEKQQSIWALFKLDRPARKAVLSVPDNTLALEYCDDLESKYGSQATRFLSNLATKTGIIVVTHVELLAHLEKVEAGDEEALKIANGTTYFLDEADKLLSGNVINRNAKLIRALKRKG